MTGTQKTAVEGDWDLDVTSTGEVDHDLPQIPPQVCTDLLRLLGCAPTPVPRKLSLLELEDLWEDGAASITLDWRDVLLETLDYVRAQLAALDVPITVEPDDSEPPGCTAVVHYSGRSCRIRYVPVEDDENDMQRIFEKLNGLLDGAVEYRLIVDTMPSDSPTFVRGHPDAFAEFAEKYPRLFSHLFEVPEEPCVEDSDEPGELHHSAGGTPGLAVGLAIALVVFVFVVGMLLS